MPVRLQAKGLPPTHACVSMACGLQVDETQGRQQRFAAMSTDKVRLAIPKLRRKRCIEEEALKNVSKRKYRKQAGSCSGLLHDISGINMCPGVLSLGLWL